MAANRPASPSRLVRRPRSAGEIINDILAFIVRIAAVVFCGALFYLGYATFSGAMHYYPAGYTPALSNQFTHNIHLSALALEVSTVVGSLCFLALLWGWDAAGLLFVLAGGVLYGAIPYFGVPFLSDASRDMMRQNHPGAEMLTACRFSGLVLLGAGALLFTGWAWDRLQTSLSAPKRVGGGLKLPYYSACWQTHYCRDEISKLCAPGRGGFHKSCWRHRSGCICDESIADRVLADARLKMGKDAEKWLGAKARAPQPTWADRFRSSYHKAPYQKVACAKCPIYSLHEVQKHRILAPLVVLIVPALMVYKADSLHTWYVTFGNIVDSFTLRMAFDPNRTASMQSQLHVALDAPAVEWMVYGVAALAAITLGARILEFWCFTAKL